MRVKLIKLEELTNALNPNNIATGFEIIAEIQDEHFKLPTLGRRFNVSLFSTSGVQEIIDNNTFKTYSSIYHWEIIS